MEIFIEKITEKTIIPVFKPWQNDNKGLFYGNEKSHSAILNRQKSEHSLKNELIEVPYNIHPKTHLFKEMNVLSYQLAE